MVLPWVNPSDTIEQGDMMTKAEQYAAVCQFILRGEDIYKTEYHRSTSGFPFSFADGPKYRTWMGEINTLNERYLQDHPLYQDIKVAYEKRSNNPHAYENMVSCLCALEADKEYWKDDLVKEEVPPNTPFEEEEVTMEPIIFISHSSKNAEIADMLRDFLVGAGIPNNYIFCSSLPGNDVRYTIPAEVKAKLGRSTVSIAILSNEYYNSMYCVNEAGIIWFMDQIPAIVIGLPEITHTNMCGFLNGDNILRRLDDQNDIFQIYDIVCENLHIQPLKMTVVSAACQKLMERYSSHISKREKTSANPALERNHQDVGISIERYEPKIDANGNTSNINFKAVLVNSSDRTLSVYSKYLHFFQDGVEFDKIEVTRYEVRTRKDALDVLNVLEPVNAIITLQPGHAQAVGILISGSERFSAEKVVFSCVADQKYYECVVKDIQK